MQGEVRGHPFGFYFSGYYGTPKRFDGDGQDDGLGGGTLGTTAAPPWLNSLVNLVPGGQNKMAELETYIRGQAEAGARQAIPEITAKVNTTASPYVIGALALGLGGFLFGLGALRAARR
jgi:hypothetical protein